jgi:virulence factor Mce-like protein
MIRNLSALALAAAAVAAGYLAYEAVLGNPGGHTWTAAFTNARGLLSGNDVRDDGAVVGRVTSITLSRQGTALVHFQLFDRAAAPRADAVAAIQAADLLGDNYLSLSPGAGRAPLRGVIDTNHTVDAPRLDEVLDSFTPDVRSGLQVLFVEAGLALDQRGGDLARATVELRPALDAASGVLDELDTQNGSLASLVTVAQRAAAQVDDRRGDLAPLLSGLAGTLDAVAANAGALDQGLSGMPATLTRLRRTAGELRASATAATPLAERLEQVTGTLGQVVSALPAFAGRARAAIPGLRDALAAAGTALTAGGPGLSRLSAAFPVLRSQAPTISTLMAELDQAAPGIAEGFFVDFPDQADESGRQPFDPFADPRRAYWRGAAVFSCEAFGVPVAPGCLQKALANLAKQPLPSSSGAAAVRPAARSRGSLPGAGTSAGSSPGATASGRPSGSAGAATGSSGAGSPPAQRQPLPNTVSSLLQYLLSP